MSTHEPLRHWARGIYPLEAGVELLIAAFSGRFAEPGWPWVQPGASADSWWVDAEQFTEENLGALSGGEQRLLRLAGSILGGPPVNLYEALPGMDEVRQRLVLLAVMHAGGNRQYWR